MKDIYPSMSLSKSLFVIVCLSVSLGLAGCQREGSAEQAGKKIDQAAEKAGVKYEEAKQSLGQKTEKAEEYMGDSAMTAKVKAEILKDPILKVFQINVTTTNGVVTLSGTVNSQLGIDRATEVARNIQSVKSVENHLVVK